LALLSGIALLSARPMLAQTPGTWSLAGNMSTARVLPTLAMLPNGTVLAAGGSTSANTDIYDPTTNTWSLTGPMTANQPNLVRALQTGAFQERDGALEQVLEIPRAERSEQLWLALAAELEQEKAFSHQELETFLATGDSSLTGDCSLNGNFSAYLHHLIMAVAQWHDTRALPALISAASTGNDALEPIVQFGEAAVAPLVSAARQGHFSEQSSVLYALQLLVEGRSDIVIAGNILPARIAPAQLSTESKRQIRDLARDLLKPKAVKHSNVLYSVANLALATGDPDLRQQVQTLVDLPSQLSDTTGIKDANQLLQAHNLIRDALAEHKQ